MLDRLPLYTHPGACLWECEKARVKSVSLYSKSLSCSIFGEQQEQGSSMREHEPGAESDRVQATKDRSSHAMDSGICMLFLALHI